MIPALVLALLVSPQAGHASDLLCTTDSGQKPAKIVVKAAGGHRLFACAVKATRRKGKLELTGFRVFATTRSGRKLPKPLFESDLDSKVFRAEGRGQELHVSELLWDGKDNVPAFETTLSCDAQGCHASKPPKCVFEKPKSGSRRALEQLGEFQHGSKKGKVPPKKLVDSLAALAYAGDADAQAVFKNRGTLSLDGDASDAYFDHQASLDRLRKAGCL